MDTVIKIVVIYFFIMFGLRVLGKREFGQLSPLELVTLLLIPEIVAEALSNGDSSLINAIVGISTLFSIVFLTSVAAHYIRPVEKIITGIPTILAADGKFIEANLNKERISTEEVYTELHKSGLVDIQQTRWVILESDGKLAIVPYESEDKGIQASEQDLPF